MYWLILILLVYLFFFLIWVERRISEIQHQFKQIFGQLHVPTEEEIETGKVVQLSSHKKQGL